jgi:hypothetical protein
VTIGVGVEGPSDYAFWDKLLHKHFRPIQFDVRIMKGRERLIRETPELLRSFRDLHYAAGFILVDRDSEPCCPAVIDLFELRAREEARRPLPERFLFICVAEKGFESWLLADQSAVSAVLPRAAYVAPPETSHLNPREALESLWRQQHGKAAFNKIDFAKQMAPRFDPKRAVACSASFQYFWTRLGPQCKR